MLHTSTEDLIVAGGLQLVGANQMVVKSPELLDLNQVDERENYKIGD
jgi:hypothetical protein